MKKGFLLASLVALSSVVCNAKSLTSSEISKIEAYPIFKNNNAKIIDGEKAKGYTRVSASVPTPQGETEFTAFLIDGQKSIFFGSGFDYETGKPLPFDMTKYEKSAAFKVGNGKEKLFIFTDPECPFCIKLEAELERIAKGRTLYIYPFPLSFHENALGMTYYILSKKSESEKREALKYVSTGNKGEVLKTIDEYNVGKYSKLLATSIGEKLNQLQKNQVDPTKLSESEKKTLTAYFNCLNAIKSGNASAIKTSLNEILKSSDSKIADDTKALAKKIMAMYQNIETQGLDKLLSTSKKASSALAVGGTPSVYTEHGEQIQNWMSLIQEKNGGAK